jgi:hypothetical protein
MAGRRVFFSFHYENDVWRASNVRKSGSFVARAGWGDASLWEEAKRKGPDAIRRLIEDGLKGTSVTAVLIGSETANRPWVNYEIQKSIERGNGLLGVRIQNVKDQHRQRSKRGTVPKAIQEGGYAVYDWDPSNFGARVERAAVAAGKPCLAHKTEHCGRCMFLLWFKV